MKKMKAIMLLSTSFLFAQSAMAACDYRNTCGQLSSSVAGTTITPTWSVVAPSQHTSESLKNDIMMVQQEAVLALESGIISKELRSAIDKLRAESTDEKMKQASDFEIIELISQIEF